jgi:hypothetical protein
MTTQDALELTSGDEVFWTDPDDNICSRNLTICMIEIIAGDFFKIWDVDGDYLEGYLWELSKPRR